MAKPKYFSVVFLGTGTRVDVRTHTQLQLNLRIAGVTRFPVSGYGRSLSYHNVMASSPHWALQRGSICAVLHDNLLSVLQIVIEFEIRNRDYPDVLEIKIDTRVRFLFSLQFSYIRTMVVFFEMEDRGSTYGDFRFVRGSPRKTPYHG